MMDVLRKCAESVGVEVGSRKRKEKINAVSSNTR